ncbi:hypothetical protein [Bacillus sp. ISL-7]|uniref:hypothetical protein n=1 Tax=Bacillus sp. ISL-7 TaxID=2819136 RepID=UPI001BEA0F66|nr:hypothetical protein [Bacillus sp. ISL-7]MBT2738146.1 hypothetical protein [Bacillus sp. ISL-7]
MSFKDRNESDEIKILRFLNSRMKLAEKDKIRFHNLVKGFEGEVMFDSLSFRAVKRFSRDKIRSINMMLFLST